MLDTSFKVNVDKEEISKRKLVTLLIPGVGLSGLTCGKDKMCCNFPPEFQMRNFNQLGMQFLFF